MGNHKQHWGAIISAIVVLFTTASVAEASRHQPSWIIQNPVTIEVMNDQGYRYNQHQRRDTAGNHRAYLEAKKNQRYKIRVRNRTNRRIGIVLTVDGRNVISGKKSYLRNNERMYILQPHETATYKGWRTGKNKVNRFFFTSAGNSYAGAWGDHSAMGVIAAAVYEEKPRYIRRKSASPGGPTLLSREASNDAGTGYGRPEYSASTEVTFRPQPHAKAKYFYKYEWRETLCKHNVINCYRPKPKPVNRFWSDDYGYAPPPPRYNNSFDSQSIDW
ncbi:MAG TPA: hypothetical protein EYH35_01970 [Thiotrichaceae bacterium]|nr:hypothetical protein [Thiotrichaceae bacterium]